MFCLSFSVEPSTQTSFPVQRKNTRKDVTEPNKYGFESQVSKIRRIRKDTTKPNRNMNQEGRDGARKNSRHEN
jgi:hypothetical protein